MGVGSTKAAMNPEHVVLDGTHYASLTNTLIKSFTALADEMQSLMDCKTVLEHKLRYAHEQVCVFPFLYSGPSPELHLLRKPTALQMMHCRLCTYVLIQLCPALFAQAASTRKQKQLTQGNHSTKPSPTSMRPLFWMSPKPLQGSSRPPLLSRPPRIHPLWSLYRGGAARVTFRSNLPS